MHYTLHILIVYNRISIILYGLAIIVHFQFNSKLDVNKVYDTLRIVYVEMRK